MIRAARMAVLLSGGGRSLQNLIDRASEGTLGVTVALVVASRADAGGLRRAEVHSIPTAVVTNFQFPGDAMSDRVFELCRDAHIDLVCLAGFLRLLRVPRDFMGRVLNIHPALLPKFGGKGMYGMHVHQAVLASRENESGCTVHYVDDEYDHGQIVLQKKVQVLQDDTWEDLADRVFAAECEAYPEAIALWCSKHHA